MDEYPLAYITLKSVKHFLFLSTANRKLLTWTHDKKKKQNEQFEQALA